MEERLEGKFVKVDDNHFIDLAVEVISKAKDKGITLRILGALSIFIHTDDKELRNLFYSLERLGEGKPLFTDLDLAAYSKQTPLIKKFFEQELKFIPNIYVNTLFAYRRNIFDHPQGFFGVDIFYDRLEFSHNVEFGTLPGKGRLDIDFPTIPLADIVLEKLQIHKINKKDIIDLIVLFAGHKLSSTEEKEGINSEYICRILSDDWGFYYDAILNLAKVKELSKEFFKNGKLPEETFNKVDRTISMLAESIEQTPKTRNWEKRAKRGIDIPWYRDVEEVDR